jgi:MFS family permease
MTAAGHPASLWRVAGAQRVLALGSLLGAVAFFAVMPFGALYLDQYTSLGKIGIGGVVGSVSLVGAVGGFGGGIVVDRFGAVRSMQVGLALAVAIYASFMVVRAEAGIITLFMLLGVSRVLIEPASKKLMSMSSDDEGRVFRLRYMTLCVGAIVGPLAGGLLYNVSIPLFFAVPAVLYGWFLVVITRNADRLQGPVVPSATARASSYPISKTIRDRRLLAAIAAGLIIFVVFSQLETMIPLVMRSHFGRSTEVLFAWLLVANAAFALLLQPVIDRASTKIGYNSLVLVGVCGFALSFACFAAMGAGVGWLYLGVALWTVGEGTLLPLPDMAVHQLATDEQKGAYFGLSELRYLGFFFGPVFGGWLLRDGTGASGSTTMYFTAAAVAIVFCLPFLIRRRTGSSAGGAPALSPPAARPPSAGHENESPMPTEQCTADVYAGGGVHVT